MPKPKIIIAETLRIHRAGALHDKQLCELSYGRKNIMYCTASKQLEYNKAFSRLDKILLNACAFLLARKPLFTLEDITFKHDIRLGLGKHRNKPLDQIPYAYLCWYYSNMIEAEDIRKAIAKQIKAEYIPFHKIKRNTMTLTASPQ